MTDASLRVLRDSATPRFTRPRIDITESAMEAPARMQDSPSDPALTELTERPDSADSRPHVSMT